MKKLIAVAVVTANIGLFHDAAFAADPVTESCGISGLISAYGLLGSTKYRTDRDGDGYGGGVAGKVNFCNVFGSSLNLQSDLYAEYSKIKGDFDGVHATSLGSVSHLYWRDPDSFALGLLVGVNQFDESFTNDDNGTNAVVGADAHLYLGSFTLAAQGAYWNNFDSEGFGASADIDEAWEVSLEGRYFMTENFKLTGRVSYDYNNETNADLKWDAWRFGGGAEYQLESTPISIFASYARVEGTMDDENMDSNIFKAGITLHFNQDTLMAEDRNGASFSTPYLDTFTNVGVAWYR